MLPVVLGSLYNILNDNLIDRHAVNTFEIESPNKRYICRIFRGDPSTEPISFLGDLGFDGGVRQVSVTNWYTRGH